MITSRTEIGLFDGTNVVELFSGVARDQVMISKIVVRNEDTSALSPLVRIHNTNRVGEDDEYIPLIESLELSAGHTVVWDLFPVTIKPTQVLEFELPGDPTANQPIWSVAWVELFV